MPIEIKNAFKLDGTDHEKILSPEKTMAVFKEKCAAAGLEILETTRRIDNNRLGIPVYFSICGHDAERLTHTRKQMGKGTTPVLAEASAVMELAERFSLYSFMEEKSNFIYDTYANVKHEALPFELIAKSVADQAGNEELEALEAIFSRIQFKWAKAYNFTRNQEMLIPLDWFFMINEFNGSSAGNGNEEAICQGACEIVERHVSALVDKNRPSPVFIDPESIANPSTKALVDKFNRAGVELYITDFSLDTGIPTVGILAFDPSTFPHTSEMVWTAGTATSPDKAMSRALTEVAQLAGDFNTASSYLASGLPKFKSPKEADYLIAPGKSGKARRVKLDQLPDISSTNIKEEIGAITRALEKNGQELITVQTTDPRLGIPAFYSMVPGTAFRERAANSSIAMFAARHIHENRPAEEAAAELAGMDKALPDRYCIKFYRGMCSLEA
ncbi:MAG: YcaO-like family protein, partial [Desulfobacteraceae bacterium]